MSTQRPTPETDAAFDALDRGACGTAVVQHKMSELERERDESREWAADAAELLESMPCMSSGQEREQERLLASHKTMEASKASDNCACSFSHPAHDWCKGIPFPNP